MDFSISDEEQLVRDTAADFARALRERSREAETNGVHEQLQAQYAEMAFESLDWPEAHGGAALSPYLKSLVVEELSYGCAGQMLGLEPRALVQYAIAALPDGDVKAALYADISGNAPRTLAFYIDAEDRLTVDANRIQGTIPWVPNSSADALVVVKQQTFYLVTSGFELNAVLPCGLQAAGASEVLVNAQAEQAIELAPDAVARMTAQVRVYLAAALIGVARASLDYAFSYTEEREVFGQKIAHHQGIAFKLAEMAIAIESARMLVMQAAFALESGPGDSEAALALIQATEMSLSVTIDGVQLLGGHGFVKDHLVEKWMREARTLSLMFGGRDGAAIDAEAAGISNWGFAAA